MDVTPVCSEGPNDANHLSFAAQGRDPDIVMVVP